MTYMFIQEDKTRRSEQGLPASFTMRLSPQSDASGNQSRAVTAVTDGGQLYLDLSAGEGSTSS